MEKTTVSILRKLRAQLGHEVIVIQPTKLVVATQMIYYAISKESDIIIIVNEAFEEKKLLPYLVQYSKSHRFLINIMVVPTWYILYCPLIHSMVPKHEKVQCSPSVLVTLEGLQTPVLVSCLPKLCVGDPIVQWSGFRRGDIIKIHGEHVHYRVVD